MKFSALSLLLLTFAHGGTVGLTFNGSPVEARRLFAPPPGAQEWSDRVFLATAEAEGPWTAFVPGATALHALPPTSGQAPPEGFAIKGSGPAHLGIDHPDGVLILLVQPLEPPAPADAARFAAGSPDETDVARTPRLQALLDTAKPGTTVVVEPGEHRVGTIFLRPGVRLHLQRGAVLSASDNDALYPKLPNFGGMDRALIVAAEAEGAFITGQGTIDGRGHIFRRNQKEKRHPGTRLLAVRDSDRFTLEGVTLLDSFAWAGHFQNCDNLTVRDVVVINEINQPGWHPKGAHVVWNNADGLNPDGCRRVVFEDLFLHTGDDAVAVKSMDPALNVSDVTVRRAIIWTPVAALKVGTESRGNTMSNIRFEDIHIARCGRALALDIFDRAVASDIVFRNLTIARAGQGLLFRAGKRSADQPGQGKIDGVLVENVSFHDSLPASAMETPLSEGGIGRVDLRNWSGPNGPARDASSARITGTDLAGSFNIQP